MSAYGIEEVTILLGLLADRDLEVQNLATELTAHGCIALSPASTEVIEAEFFTCEGRTQSLSFSHGTTASIGLELWPLVADFRAMKEEELLRHLHKLLINRHSWGLTLIEYTREGRTTVGLLFGELLRLTTLTTSEEGRATGEAIDVDLPLRSKAVTDEESPVSALVIGEQIVVVGRVVRHTEERRLEEAITLLGEARHIEVIATEACGRAASEEERHTILEEEGRADRRIGLQRLGRYLLTLPVIIPHHSEPSKGTAIGDDAIAMQQIDEAEEGEDGRRRVQAVTYCRRLHGKAGGDIDGEHPYRERAPINLNEEVGKAIDPDECAIDDAEFIGCAIHTLGTCYLLL